ncbi:hypothetical protein CTZ28_28460 [Streptomyces shenzhenensis]|uniref:Uncharacterized protein n=1 Tax=Streptomyces shenzhenensis TaxID=943815 RepID=A0A3M0I3C0_9ACTN|nr:hypothetical protein CTZ28_28460 [Streptomyces shenzhenensis]
MAMEVMSPTCLVPGAGVVKSRPGESAAGMALSAGRVSVGPRRRGAPAMSRSMRLPLVMYRLLRPLSASTSVRSGL